MEKRNTMLLTVIAVATLLVAVVGATFAYFSLSVTGEANSSKATVTTRSVGLVKINSTSDNLTLKVTPQDMAKPTNENSKDEYYYAVVNSESHGKDTGGIWEKQEAGSDSAPKETTATLANITRTGGDKNDSYTCGYKVTITADGTNLKKFTNGNLVLTITGDGISESGAEDSSPKSVTINDFSNFNGSKELHGKVELAEDTAPDPGDELVTATLYLVNKYNEVQSGFEGVNINLTFNVEPEGTCTIESTSDVE